jgi:hypothetical protein
MKTVFEPLDATRNMTILTVDILNVITSLIARSWKPLTFYRHKLLEFAVASPLHHDRPAWLDSQVSSATSALIRFVRKPYQIKAA